MKWMTRLIPLILMMLVMVVCLGNVRQQKPEVTGPPGSTIAAADVQEPMQAAAVDANFLVMMFLGAWLHSKVARLTKEYTQVSDARAGFRAKLKDKRLHWIPGAIRKRAEQWVDRMVVRSKTIEELQANMEASITAGLADVTAAVRR